MLSFFWRVPFSLFLTASFPLIGLISEHEKTIKFVIRSQLQYEIENRDLTILTQMRQELKRARRTSPHLDALTALTEKADALIRKRAKDRLTYLSALRSKGRILNRLHEDLIQLEYQLGKKAKDSSSNEISDPPTIPIDQKKIDQLLAEKQGYLDRLGHILAKLTGLQQQLTEHSQEQQSFKQARDAGTLPELLAITERRNEANQDLNILTNELKRLTAELETAQGKFDHWLDQEFEIVDALYEENYQARIDYSHQQAKIQGYQNTLINLTTSYQNAIEQEKLAQNTEAKQQWQAQAQQYTGLIIEQESAIDQLQPLVNSLKTSLDRSTHAYDTARESLEREKMSRQKILDQRLDNFNRSTASKSADIKRILLELDMDTVRIKWKLDRMSREKERTIKSLQRSIRSDFGDHGETMIAAITFIIQGDSQKALDLTKSMSFPRSRSLGGKCVIMIRETVALETELNHLRHPLPENTPTDSEPLLGKVQNDILITQNQTDSLLDGLNGDDNEVKILEDLHAQIRSHLQAVIANASRSERIRMEKLHNAFAFRNAQRLLLTAVMRGDDPSYLISENEPAFQEGNLSRPFLRTSPLSLVTLFLQKTSSRSVRRRTPVTFGYIPSLDLIPVAQRFPLVARERNWALHSWWLILSEQGFMETEQLLLKDVFAKAHSDPQAHNILVKGLFIRGMEDIANFDRITLEDDNHESYQVFLLGQSYWIDDQGQLLAIKKE